MSLKLKSVQIMLSWNFDINAVTNENETPILLASRNGHKNLTGYLLESGADPLISTKSKSNPLAEAAKKNRPEIVELLQDAINCSIPSSGSTNGSQDEPVLAGGPTSTEYKKLSKQLHAANIKVKEQDNQIKQLQAEINFHEQESVIKSEQMSAICEKYRNDSIEKDEMVRNIKRDIDLVEMDVKKSNQLLQAEQDIRESLEDENMKLMEMIRQREKTIKLLEVKTRNALEISIKADDAIRSNANKIKKLEEENSALKSAENVQTAAENMAQQDDFITFGLNLVSKINDLNTAVVDLTKQNAELKTQLAEKPKERIVEKIVEKVIEKRVEIQVESALEKSSETDEPNMLEALKNSLSFQEEMNKQLAEEQYAAEKELELLQADVLSLIKANSHPISPGQSLTEYSHNEISEITVQNNPEVETLRDEISILHQENSYLARRLNKLEDPKRKS